MSFVVNPDYFPILAAELLQYNPGITSLQIQPTAVLNQVYPPGTAPIGLDLLTIPSEAAEVYRTIALAGVLVDGPMTLVQGGIGFIVRHPVFVGEPKGLATWWGEAAGEILVPAFLNGTGINDIPQQGYDYLLEYPDSYTNTTLLIGNSTVTFDRLQAVQTTIPLPNGYRWTLFIAPIGGDQYYVTAGQVVMVVGVAIVASVLCVSLLLAIGWYNRAGRRDLARAPTAPPFVILFTDIEASTNFWASQPAAMAKALALHNGLIRTQIRHHNSYEVKTIGDSFMVACRTARSGLDLALGIQRVLEACTEWPPEVEEFYGEPRLRVRMGLHYCLDADVVRDTLVAAGYDYLGNDVNIAARIASKAGGGEVYISEDLALQAASLGGYTVQPLGRMALRGIKEPQPIHQLIVSTSRPVIPRQSPIRQHRQVSRQFTDAGTSVCSCPRGPRDNVGELVRQLGQVEARGVQVAGLGAWVALILRMLRLALNPLGRNQQKELTKTLCRGWGFGGRAQTLDNLALRIGRILLPLYPDLFPDPDADLPPDALVASTTPMSASSHPGRPHELFP